MKVLSKTWLRFLFALAITGFFMELYHQFTGNDLTRNGIISFIIFFGIFMLLTFAYGFQMKKKYKQMDVSNDELLDLDKE
ncbi:MAG: hypothetical protein H6599_00575 [Flavobacteriales bacterium]|nr:hypothetical protein [Flavobacteriales bacterium]